MIYSNKLVVSKGRDGSTLDYVFKPPKTTDSDDNSTALTSDPAVYLGEVDGRKYRYFPDGLDIANVGEQSTAIDFKLETSLPEDVRISLRAQATCAFKKEAAREEITLKVGDVLDLLADTSQLVEFAIIAVSALWADKAGLAPLSEQMIKDYGERGAAVMQAVARGDLMLRSSFETPEKMITTIMPRYSQVQQIVRDRYILPLKELGL